MLGEIHNFSLGVEKKKKVNESLCSQCGGPWILRLKEGSNSNYDEQRMPKQRQTDTEKETTHVLQQGAPPDVLS